MATGLDYAQEAIATGQRLNERLASHEGLDENWRNSAQQRLAAALEALRAMEDRFFLRSRLCLPFAKRCAQQMDKLELALAADVPDSASADSALADLEKAVQVLDDRSGAQGMVIT